MSRAYESAPALRRGRSYRYAAPVGRTDWSDSARLVALAAFALLLVANVAIPSLKIAGLPFRGLLTLGMLFFLPLACPDMVEKALRKYLPLIGLGAGLAALGTFVSIVNEGQGDEILRSVIEFHVQAIATVLVAGTLAEIAGRRACVIALVVVIGGSAFAALLQMAGADFAWQLRRMLGPLSHDEVRRQLFDRRPPGLSYSPIQLSNQICLAFAAFLAMSDRERILNGRPGVTEPAIMIALGLLVVAALATATRSPILGGLVFLAIFASVRRSSGLPLAIALVGLVAYLYWPQISSMIQDSVPRIVQINDNSAASRSVYVYYGFRLFLDNPLGYGLTFHPASMWQDYWSDLYVMQAATGAQENALHNYALSMLNVYGVGLILFAPLIFKLLKNAGSMLLFFIPYALHILVHNSGPFFGDTIFWFAVAALAAPSVARHRRSSADTWQSNASVEVMAQPMARPSARAQRMRLKDSWRT